jgi:hypothetical protein
VHDPFVPHKNRDDRNAYSRKRWAANAEKMRAYHRQKAKEYRAAMTPEELEERRIKDRAAKKEHYRRNKNKYKMLAQAVDPATGKKKATIATTKSRKKLVDSLTGDELEAYKERQRTYWRKYNSKEKGLDRLRRASRKSRMDPMFRVVSNLRTLCCRFMTGKNRTARARELLGCTRDELRAHIEKQFQTGVGWENYGLGIGKWNIDHRIPLTHFANLATDTEQQKIAFGFRNLSPKWCPENSRKRNFFAEPLLPLALPN